MRYQVTKSIEPLLKEVVGLVGDIRGWLASVSDAASDEWDTLRSRLPTDGDIRQGFTSLSEQELKDMRSTLWRFQEMVSIEQPAFQPTLLATTSSALKPPNIRAPVRATVGEGRLVIGHGAYVGIGAA